MPRKPDHSYIQAGKYLSLAFTLPATALGGFLVGSFFNHWLDFAFLPAFGIILGVVGGLLQIFRELARETKNVK